MADNTINRITVSLGPKVVRVRVLGLSAIMPIVGAMAASVACASGASGDLQVGRALSSTVRADVVASGIVQIARPLAGVAAAASASAADLRVVRGLNASLSTSGVATGILSVGGGFDAASLAIATATGAITVARPLASLVSAGASASGALSTFVAVSAQANSPSSAQGDLTAVRALAATISSAGSATGTLNVAQGFDSTTSAPSIATATITVARPLASNVTAPSTASGLLTTVINLSAQSAGTSSAQGDITLTRALAANIPSAGFATGTLSIAKGFDAPITSLSTTSGDLTVARQLAALVPTASVATAAVTVARNLSASVSATSLATGALAATASSTDLWRPTDLASCVAWWDASQGFTTDGSTTQWTDVKSGIVASGTGTSAPTYSATARNGKPGLIFNGSQSLSFNPANVLLNNLTAACSGYLQNVSGQWRRAFAFGNGDNNSSLQIIRRGSDNRVAEFTLGGATGLDWANLDRFVAVTKGGTVGTLYVDGASTLSGTFASALSGTAGYIGRGLGYADNWLGAVQQIVICNTVLSDADRQTLEGWESWYTGKNGSNLPANHPYKSAAPTIYRGPVSRDLSATVAATSSATGDLTGPGAPAGFIYVADPDGSRLTDPDGAYLMEAN